MLPDRGGSSGSADHPQRLKAALDRLGLVLPSGAEEQLLRYMGLLERWNGVYNLTALRDPDRMLTHHLFDCLAVLPSIQRQLSAPQMVRVLDVGSGAGLPGVVLAVAEPAWEVWCVDKADKKAAFIQQAAVELGLRNLHSRHARVEALGPSSFDLVTSRAFASLADFAVASRACLAESGVWAAMKGRTPVDEIAALPRNVEVFHVEPIGVPEVEAERCVVWMRPTDS